MLSRTGHGWGYQMFVNKTWWTEDFSSEVMDYGLIKLKWMEHVPKQLLTGDIGAEMRESSGTSRML